MAKGQVVAVVSDDSTEKTLHRLAKECIMPESTVYTGELSAYHGLENISGYQHRRINHSAGVYVMGDVHTNIIEGF